MLQSIGRDYLVEVFRPRNCYEQDWADIDTFQFRLESQDLLIGRVIDQENGCEEWGICAGFEGVHQGSNEGLVGECVCWLADDELVKTPGILGDVDSLVLGILKGF